MAPDPAPGWRRRLRWFDLIPEALLLAGLGLFTVTEPRAALSAFKSPYAVVLMLAVSAGWVIARAISFAVVRWTPVRVAVFVVAALAILKVVVLPSYQDTTVVETLAAPPVTTVASTPTPTVPDPAPVAIATGALGGVDHRASGTVTLYRQPDGHHVVGLEEFDIQPGPAYAVFVVPGAHRRDTDAGTRLAALRGNKGTQYYDVPADVSLAAGEWTVLVWCETFDVPVASSTPT